MKLTTFFTALLSLNSLHADSNNGSYLDRPSPIGVMEEHRHPKGEFMLSYRYMFMSMDGNYNGTDRISTAGVLADPRFRITPTDMDMEMHMVGLMYGLTDRITLMGMFNFVEMSMNHETMSGSTFRTESSGLGDSSIGAIIGLWGRDRSRLNLGLQVLLPTAETDKEDLLPPAGGVRRLPYPMQLGSGSWGISPSLTWTEHLETFSYGAQASANFLLDDNDEGYRLGNHFNITSWITTNVTENTTVSVRTSYAEWSNIHGRDQRIMGPVPTAFTELRAGKQLDFSVGFSYLEPRSSLLASIEAGKTVWRDLNGPQLSNDYSLTAGLRFSW